MRADERRELATLAGRAGSELTRGIQSAHTGLVSRSASGVKAGMRKAGLADYAPIVTAAEVGQRALVGTIYPMVSAGIRTLGVVGGAIAARQAERVNRDTGVSPPSLTDSPRGHLSLAVLNGFLGHDLEHVHSSFALPLSIREDNREVELTPEGVRAAYPDATGQIVVLVHGFLCTDRSWEWRAESVGRDNLYAARLRADFGLTPVRVRYNTGRRISTNAALLGAALAQLVECWPVPVERIVLIGHSMGGLVVTSAAAQAARRLDADALDSGQAGSPGWVRLVTDVITLGSPHSGNGLERSVNRLGPVVQRHPELTFVAEVLRSRSDGIRDLRHGNLFEEDWAGHHPEDPEPHRTQTPHAPWLRHHTVIGVVGRSEGALSSRLLGDLVVSTRSARAGLAREDDVRVVSAMQHLDLLSHPRVYEQIRAMLSRA